MTSIMTQEALSAADVVEHQLQQNQAVITRLAQHLQQNPPPFAFTIARGSSDHAAYFAKYCLAIKTGLMTSSMPPSVSSIYASKLHANNALALAISQSGASPDICDSLQAAKEAGATTVAIVNHVDSPLASIADFVIPMHAGEEKSVAATKTYIASLTAIIQLVAHLANDQALLDCLPELPNRMRLACDESWQSAVTELKDVVNLIVIGRGLNYPIAEEAALKFKETANVHAEAFSAAEFQHGPMALARPHFPLLMFAQKDEALPSTIALASKMSKLGVNTIMAAASDIDLMDSVQQHLPLPPSLHPLCDPIVSIQAFYPMMASLAEARGYNPDTPDNLKKVTETH